MALIITDVLWLYTVSPAISILTMCFLCWNIAPQVHGQSDLQTNTYRNMVLYLGNGLETNARLNLPVIGEGP